MLQKKIESQRPVSTVFYSYRKDMTESKDLKMYRLKPFHRALKRSAALVLQPKKRLADISTESKRPEELKWK